MHLEASLTKGFFSLKLSVASHFLRYLPEYTIQVWLHEVLLSTGLPQPN